MSAIITTNWIGIYREIWGEHVHHGLWERGDETALRSRPQSDPECGAERGEITAGKRVCDVGCGYGGTARVLETEFGAIVSAITLSSAQYCHAVAQRGDARTRNICLATGRATRCLLALSIASFPSRAPSTCRISPPSLIRPAGSEGGRVDGSLCLAGGRGFNQLAPASPS